MSALFTPSIRLLCTALTLRALVAPPHACAAGADEPDYAPDVVIVGMPAGSNDATLQPALRRVGGSRAHVLFRTTQAAARAHRSTPVDVLRVSLPPGSNVPAAVAALRQAGALFAEPDYRAHVAGINAGRTERSNGREPEPNDPLFEQQWAPQAINAPTAWKVTTGTPSALIAVIDSGVDRTHPDLAANLWINPGDIPDNGLDDDNNGYVDDVHGWDFVDDDATPEDLLGHGTPVAGIAAASTDDGIGIAGMCWNCRILPLRVVQANGVANYSDIAAAIAYAAAKGARVINISLGGRTDSAALRLAVDAANDAVIVAAAGNDARSQAVFPAAYPSVLAIAATTPGDARWPESNFGTWVDLAAPGHEVIAPASGGGWITASGTSLAVPHVAGVAALLRALHPDYTPTQVRTQLLATARPISTAADQPIGHGIIDAGRAVGLPRPLITLASTFINGVVNGRPNHRESSNLSVMLHNDGFDAAMITASLSSTSPFVTISDTVTAVDSLNSGATHEIGPLPFFIDDAAGYGRDITLTLQLRSHDGTLDASFDIPLTTQGDMLQVCGAITNPLDPTAHEVEWTQTRTYVVTCDSFVAAGDTLRIQPGVMVQFAAGVSLEVRGVLIAAGMGERSVMFGPSSANAAWGGLNFASGTQMRSSLQRVHIRGADIGIHCVGTAPQLNEVVIDGGGIRCDAGGDGGAAGRRLRTALISTDGAGFRRFAVGDADGDGDPDLALLRGPSRIDVEFNDGSGHFGSRVTLTTVGRDWSALTWGDFDSDGQLHLLALSPNAAHRIFLRRNDG